MHFINDIDPIVVPRGRCLHGFPHLADVIHAVTGRPVNLHDIEGAAPADLHATGALQTGRRCRPLLAVQRLREDTGHGGFPDAAHSGEQIGVRGTARGQRVGQCADDVRLTAHFGKRHRAVLTG